MSAFYISAAHKSSGKTTLSIGLSAAMRRRDLRVRAFKKGPDYIDPIWLAQATDQACHNLDFFTSSDQFIRRQFQQFADGNDAVLVEGNMGLFDGLSLDGSDSNAAMAKLLGLPVVLVVDCSGTSRGIAPLLIGYQQFDSALRYAGVILNKVAGSRHESKLREVVETYTDFPLLGVVHRNASIGLTERHLGLIPGNEVPEASLDIIELLADQAEQHIDIDQLLRLPPVSPDPDASTNQSTPKASLHPLRIALPMDRAFGFYYPGDLQRFADLGVELLPFNALTDPQLPANVDGLLLGGGFPETQIAPLANNRSMLTSIRESIVDGLPAYAECGGLMYLCTNLIADDTAYPLCGVIPGSVHMHKRPQGRGYVRLRPTEQHPWYQHGRSPPALINAHEFHYSSVHELSGNPAYAYTMQRGTGIDGMNDGIILHNLVASYCHLRTTDQCNWVDDFVDFVARHKRA